MGNPTNQPTNYSPNYPTNQLPNQPSIHPSTLLLDNNTLTWREPFT